MARLTAIKKVAEQRESEEMVKEVDGLIAGGEEAVVEAPLCVLAPPAPQDQDLHWRSRV